MDSVTQAALGAAIGVAVMHRHRPVWQSALAGALIGTLPDLDVFIDKGDAVRDMLAERLKAAGLTPVELPFGGLTMTADLHLGRRDGEWAKTWLFGMGLRF